MPTEGILLISFRATTYPQINLTHICGRVALRRKISRQDTKRISRQGANKKGLTPRRKDAKVKRLEIIDDSVNAILEDCGVDSFFRNMVLFKHVGQNNTSLFCYQLFQFLNFASLRLGVRSFLLASWRETLLCASARHFHEY